MVSGPEARAAEQPADDGGQDAAGHPRPPLASWVVAVMLAAIGLNLRASLGSVPPLLGQLESALHLSNTAAGLLSSVAILCMGLSAPLGQRMSTRLGPERATGLLMLALALAGLVRLIPSGAGLLFASAAAAGVAMGAISALMPSLIAHHLPGRRGFVTGVYSTGLASGVALAAGTAVPLEHLLGGWRPSLATWGVIAAVTGGAWMLLTPGLRARVARRPAAPVIADHRMPWRSRTAWWVTAYSTALMIIGFSAQAWMIPLYVGLGKTSQQAADIFVVFQATQLITMLTVPAVTDHTRDRRPLLALLMLAVSAGVGMLVLDPVGMAYPAAALFGMGIGGGSTLGLVLIIDATASQADAARLGAMTLLVAFLAGGTGPLLLGMLRDLTGGFTVGYAVIGGLSLLSLASVGVYRPGRSIADQYQTAPGAAAVEAGPA